MHEWYDRPQSAINIVDFPDSTESNPHPISDADKSFGEFISASKLKEVANTDNLTDVVELKIKVDSSETSIGNIGSMLPNLKVLKMNNSFLNSLRDLGTSLQHLSTLWLSRCCLTELDGISSFTALKELYVAYNDICDLSPLSMLENLEVLDLEGNNIDDISQIEFLALCRSLSILTLRGNPVVISPSVTTNKKDLKFYSYRDAILRILPDLQILDDQSFSNNNVEGIPDSLDALDIGIYDADQKIIQESLKKIEEELLQNDTTEETEFSRPVTARKREGSSKRNSASSNSSDSYRSMENNRIPESLAEDLESETSELTHGNVMCGNPVAALRNRNKKTNTSKMSVCKKVTQRLKEASLENGNQVNNTHTSTRTNAHSPDREDIFEELRQWRLQNERLLDIDNESNQNKNQRRCLQPKPPSSGNRPSTAGELRSRRYHRMISPDLGYTSASLSQEKMLQPGGVTRKTPPFAHETSNRSSSALGTSLDITSISKTRYKDIIRDDT